MNPTEPLPDAFIFDLDGTLLDTFAGHFTAYEVMLRHFDIVVPRNRLLEVYHPDWFKVYRALGVPEEQWAVADEIWLAEAARHRAKLFPGVEQMLKELRKQRPLAIVTSGSGNRVRLDMSYVGIEWFFRTIITGENVTEPKPAPEGILKALRILRVSPERAIYVGDSPIDHLTAQAAGVPFVGVAGPLLPEPEQRPFPVLSSVVELPNFLAQGSTPPTGE